MAAVLALRRRGVSLLELLIVLAIIGIMLGLLFPAIQAARRASLSTACDNNIHQLSIAMAQYLDINNHFFPMPPDGVVPNGWLLVLLPFIEEGPLYNRFGFEQPLTSPRNLEAAFHRPNWLLCPVTPELESTIKGVGVTHYLMSVDQKDRPRPRRDRSWIIRDVPEDSHLPWITSPEVDYPANYPAPHSTAFGL
jgi:prepilin-type N-terminal cleavage/methylation domain-containing protein